MNSFSDIPATGDFRDSNTYKHAITELDATFDSEDEYNRMMAVAVLQLLEVFHNQGHSGFSAGCVRQVFNKLSNFEPLGPLTGAESEWAEAYCYEGTQQNKRASNVFREAGGAAYQYDYYIFRDPNGSCCTNRDSRRYITEWPYTPGHEYIDREPSV